MSYEAFLKMKILRTSHPNCAPDCEAPITLADVLIATEEKWRTYFGTSPVNGKEHVNVFGGDKHLGEGAVLYAIVSKWNLTTDLDGQSEEVKQFLFSLLK